MLISGELTSRTEISQAPLAARLTKFARVATVLIACSAGFPDSDTDYLGPVWVNVGAGSPRSNVLSLASQEQVELSFMSFNIKAGEMGVDRVETVIDESGADVVALQEVTQSSFDQLRDRDFPYGVFAQTTLKDGEPYGVALLSKRRLQNESATKLPTPDGIEPRALVTAVIDIGQNQMLVGGTHLSQDKPFEPRTEVRLQQVAAIDEQVEAKLEEDGLEVAVLGGDMNFTPDSVEHDLLKDQEFVDLLGSAGMSDVVTYLHWPRRQIDYILTRSTAANQVVLQAAGRLDGRRVSDHAPIIANISVR